MTKSVRIENADTSDHKVRIFTEDLQPDGSWKRCEGEGFPLDYPTALLTATIWAQRRLVVEELVK